MFPRLRSWIFAQKPSVDEIKRPHRYLRYALSYRDLQEMMTERGLSLDHTTIFRWVQEYAPELNKRSRPYLKKTTAILNLRLGQQFEEEGHPLQGI